MEILFKGVLHALSAHHGVHGVAQILVDLLVLVGLHGAGVAENVGSIGGVVLPDGGGLHNDAGHAQLHDGRQLLRAHVLGQAVVVQGNALDGADGELKAHRDQAVGLLVGEVVGDVVVGAEVVHKVLRRHVGIPAAAGEEGAEVPLPDGGIVVQGVGIGLRLADGEVALHVDAQLVAEV